MIIDKFYLVFFAIVVTLGMVKYSTDRNNIFLTVISLLCCFCFLETLFPVEEKQVQWACFGGCSAILMFTTLLYVAILRKLNYTQELVKKTADKGWSKWIFSWITHPNPGPIPEKEVFNIVVWLLTMNLMIFYYLMKMLGLVS